jgi:uncharacterized protein YndB with AHSA1/START domain
MEKIPNRIEKQIELRAPRSRVWKALTTAAEFGAWFGVELSGELRPKEKISGRLTYPGYEHMTLEMTVEKIEAEHTFSYRWIPYAVDPKIDYSGEEPTLVEFTLRETPAGTLLQVVETGFDRVPLARRAKAFQMNDSGWAEQLRRIAEYLRKCS